MLLQKRLENVDWIHLAGGMVHWGRGEAFRGGNESFDFIKDGEFLDCLSDSWLLKKDWASMHLAVNILNKLNAPSTFCCWICGGVVVIAWHRDSSLRDSHNPRRPY
jgi:hypothetical protein